MRYCLKDSMGSVPSPMAMTKGWKTNVFHTSLTSGLSSMYSMNRPLWYVSRAIPSGVSERLTAQREVSESSGSDSTDRVPCRTPEQS